MMNLRIAITAVILFVLAAPAQAQHNLTVEPYRFETRDGREVDAELGRFEVPENRTADSDRTIELAFVRFPSTNPNPGSPIVYLAGGPGGSGIGTARGSRLDLFMAMREIADVIAFDQRGTGLSERLPDCPHRWSYPPEKPASREDLLEVALENTRACAAFWREEGVDLSAYNTNENADDLASLREVLGADRISLWSISYGTHLAMAAIKRHPESLDRVILAGMEGPDHTVKMPSDQQRLLERIAELADSSKDVNHAVPDLLETMETVLARLEKEPAMAFVSDENTGDSVRVGIGKFDVQRITAQMLHGPGWAASIPAFYHAMMQRHFSMAADLTLHMNRSGGLGAMSAAMDAASGISDARLEQYRRERRETLLSDAINFPYPEIIEALDVPDLGEAFRAPVQSDVPALLISGTLDGRTPVSNAEEVRPGLPNSAHLIIEGAGHSDPLFLSSPRILEVMQSFLRGEPVRDEVISLPPMEFRPIE
jgi:pimeloyl-ACP methyl ester carboxylesterase